MKNDILQSNLQQQSIIMDGIDDIAFSLNKNLVDDTGNQESSYLNKTILLNSAHELYKNLLKYQLIDIIDVSPHCSQSEKKLWTYPMYPRPRL